MLFQYRFDYVSPPIWPTIILQRHLQNSLYCTLWNQRKPTHVLCIVSYFLIATSSSPTASDSVKKGRYIKIHGCFRTQC